MCVYVFIWDLFIYVHMYMFVYNKSHIYAYINKVYVHSFHSLNCYFRALANT